MQIEEQLKYSNFVLHWAKNASQYAWQDFQNVTTRRQFSKITNIGTAAMEDAEKQQKLQKVIARMKTVYSTGSVCLTNSECLPLEPDLVRLMATSRDYDELLKVWRGWRDVSGKLMKDDYAEFVTLSNEAINMSGYRDTGEYWKSLYESNSFANDVEQLFLQMEPFYQQLHAYTKSKLKEVYGADKFPPTGHIPAHILGNMWAQTWSNLQDILEPFPGKGSMDVTDELVKQVTHLDEHVTRYYNL
ncbi:angiotensin-converting enzyme-like isoform X2 [Gigantopelta aegis]|uniref:angiotensin-converting enzyme-like isoform X2 n=1 Tax=Gigantopelta aegis TaxID=1735272 RepID=UPI001B88836B|nr:angiotensin-converting enzyme-like isoform X2 [Gigantopelta aegis]